MKVYACPSCGADVPFETGGGAFAVCSYCQTLLFRGEKNIEKWGKVAELIDTEPRIALGMRGRFEGRPFCVIGRIQKTQGNAFWDEWHLSFEERESAWLSFSEGQWQLMFSQGEMENFPAHSQLPPLTRFEWNHQSFVVEEWDTAQTHSAAGQLPSFAATHAYVDATGANGAFASVDFGGKKPELFLGKTVSFRALGLNSNQMPPRPRSHALAQARCPSCNGPLSLKAPDAARRVGCPFCNSLIDVSSGHLQFLSKLRPPPISPLIPLGKKGTLEGVQWTCLAMLTRSCRIGLDYYPWAEYLLWEEDEGFAWLVESDKHWSFLRPIPAADVLDSDKSFSIPTVTDDGLHMTPSKYLAHGKKLYAGKYFKPFQSIQVVTEHVVGECYWEVAQGDVAFSVTWVNPPLGICLDQTQKEASFSLSTYLSPTQVQEAFGIENPLPRPEGIAATQPKPQSTTVRWSLIYAALALFLSIALGVLSPHEEVAEFSVRLSTPRTAGQNPATGDILLADHAFFHLELPRTQRLMLGLQAPTLRETILETNLTFLPGHLEDGFDMHNPTVATYIELGHKDFGSTWGSHAELSRTKRLGPFSGGPTTLLVSWRMNKGALLDRPHHASVKIWKEAKAPLVHLLMVWGVFLAAILITHGQNVWFETSRWENSVFQSPSKVASKDAAHTSSAENFWGDT